MKINEACAVKAEQEATETSEGVLEDLDDEDVHEPHDHHNYIKIEPLYTTVSDK